MTIFVCFLRTVLHNMSKQAEIEFLKEYSLTACGVWKEKKKKTTHIKIKSWVCNI